MLRITAPSLGWVSSWVRHYWTRSRSSGSISTRPEPPSRSPTPRHRPAWCLRQSGSQRTGVMPGRQDLKEFSSPLRPLRLCVGTGFGRTDPREQRLRGTSPRGAHGAGVRHGPVSAPTGGPRSPRAQGCRQGRGKQESIFQHQRPLISNGENMSGLERGVGLGGGGGARHEAPGGGSASMALRPPGGEEIGKES